MSAINFFLSKGYTPVNKNTIISGVDTVTLWAPLSSANKIVLTDLSLSCINASTIAFYIGSSVTGPAKVAEFILANSATVSPVIGGWDSSGYGYNLYCKLKTSGTDGMRVNLTGFEIPTW